MAINNKLATLHETTYKILKSKEAIINLRSFSIVDQHIEISVKQYNWLLSLFNKAFPAYIKGDMVRYSNDRLVNNDTIKVVDTFTLYQLHNTYYLQINRVSIDITKDQQLSTNYLPVKDQIKALLEAIPKECSYYDQFTQYLIERIQLDNYDDQLVGIHKRLNGLLNLILAGSVVKYHGVRFGTGSTQILIDNQLTTTYDLVSYYNPKLNLTSL